MMVGKLPEPIIISIPSTSASSATTNDVLSNTAQCSSSDAVIGEVQEDIVKIQHVIVDLVQRIRALEQQAQQHYDSNLVQASKRNIDTIHQNQINTALSNKKSKH